MPAAGHGRILCNMRILLVSEVFAYRAHYFGEDVCDVGCSSLLKSVLLCYCDPLLESFKKCTVICILFVLLAFWLGFLCYYHLSMFECLLCYQCLGLRVVLYIFDGSVPPWGAS